jgi:hypothetical protein
MTTRYRLLPVKVIQRAILQLLAVDNFTPADERRIADLRAELNRRI